MKKSLIRTSLLVAMFYSNLTTAAQSTSPTTKEFPVTRQNTVLPQASWDERAQTVNPSNSGSTLEIPQAVKGCWEVTIDGPPDSFQYIKGPQIGGWLPMKKKLCFVETASHSFQITYQTTVADTAYAATRGYSVGDFQSHEEVIWSDEKGNFTLRSVTTNRQPLGLFRGQIEITTVWQLECRFVAEELVVEASSFSSCTGAPRSGCDGGPTSTTKRHLVFHRASGAP